MKPLRGRKTKSSSGRRKASSTQVSTGGGPPGDLAFQTPQLPQEVVEIAIEFLRHDKLSLLRCSLVSRAWAHSTATYLFRYRRWPKCEHYWSKKRSVQNCVCSLEKPRLPTLRMSLLSSERIHNALQNLELRFDRVPGGARPDGEGYMPMGCVSMEELLDVFEVIPNLQSVRLSGIYGHSWPTKDRSAGQATRKLDTFVVTDAVHLGSCFCAALIAYFGSVSRVTLSNVNSTLPEDPLVFPSEAADRSHIRLLDFDSLCRPSSLAKYLDAFSMVVDVSSLAEISANVPNGDEETRGVVTFLDAAANLSLSTFRMTYNLDPPPGGLPGFSPDSAISSLAELIAHCSARTVDVELMIYTHRKPIAIGSVSGCFREWDWHQMEAAVAHREKLEVLRIRVKAQMFRETRSDLTRASCKDIRASLMPMLSKRLFTLLDIYLA